MIVIGSNLSPGLDRAGSAVAELPEPVSRGRIFLPGAIHGEPTCDARISNNYEDR